MQYNFLINRVHFIFTYRLLIFSVGGSRAPACKQNTARRQGGENYSVKLDGERYSTESSPHVYTYYLYASFLICSCTSVQ